MPIPAAQSAWRSVIIPAVKLFAALCVTLAAALSLTGCSGGSGQDHPSVPPVTVPIGGRVHVEKWWTSPDGKTCTTLGNALGHAGSSPIDDVKRGAPVVITDESGSIVRRGHLMAGQVSHDPLHPHTHFCEFDFYIFGVRLASSSFGIQVGRRPVAHFDRPHMTLNPTITVG